MPLGKFEKKGTLLRPGPVGRSGRFILGILLLYLFIDVLGSYKGIVNPRIPNSILFWIGFAYCFWILPEIIRIGFGHNFGRWPRLISISLLLAAVVFNFVRYEQYWGPPVGLFSFLLLVYVLGHLGLSLVVAGTFGVPG